MNGKGDSYGIMNDKGSQYCERQTTLLIGQTAYLLVLDRKDDQGMNAMNAKQINVMLMHQKVIDLKSKCMYK